MLQEIITYIIITAAVVYAVVLFVKKTREDNDCGCGKKKNCRHTKK